MSGILAASEVDKEVALFFRAGTAAVSVVKAGKAEVRV